MSLSKETLEPAASPSKPSAPRSSDAARLRADAVSLDVPVKLHGSRVTAMRAGVPQTEPFEEQTSTMIVFPHGGVVRLTTTVTVGQMLVLTNLRTNQDAICRVVKARAYSNTQAYVELEFTHRLAGYWGVHFPEDEEESRLPAKPVAETEKKPASIPPVTMKIETLPKPPTAPPRMESAFASFGSKEDVQPSASQTDSKPPAAPVTSVRPAIAATLAAPVAQTPSAAQDAPPAKPAQLLSSQNALDSLPVENEIDLDSEPEGPHAASTSLSSFTGGASIRAANLRTPDFGAHLNSSSASHGHSEAPGGGTWKWVAACALFAVLGMAGGALYFRQQGSLKPQPAVPAAAAPVNSAPEAAENSTPAAGNFSSGTTNLPDTQTVAPPELASVNERATHPAAPVQPAIEAPHSPSSSASRPAASVSASGPTSAPANFAASKARPVVRKSGNNEVSAPAPTVSSVPTSSGLSDVLGGSNSALPPPPVQPRVSGQLVAPKLAKSVAPLYPSAARAANVSGNVVITAQVDKFGNVGATKVISGPVALQLAAINAVKQWKYSPATLDGESVASEVTVTIKFQQQ